MQTLRSFTFSRIASAALICVALAAFSTHIGAVRGEPGTQADPNTTPAAAPPSDTPEGSGPRTAAGELQRARQALLKQSSVQARLLETVSILDRSFKADGRYLQTNDRKLRLELKLKVGGVPGSLLQVCDGQLLFSRYEINKDVSITRCNVQQVLDAAARNTQHPEHAVIADLGLGGLPALLAALDRNLEFNGLKTDRLRERAVVVVQGTWRAETLKLLGGDGNLPAYLPDLVRITLDDETGFPHRIQYLKRNPDRDTLKPLLTLDFLDVLLGEPVDMSEFKFVAPDEPQPVEVTQQYLQMFAAPAAPSPTAANPTR